MAFIVSVQAQTSVQNADRKLVKTRTYPTGSFAVKTKTQKYSIAAIDMNLPVSRAFVIAKLDRESLFIPAKSLSLSRPTGCRSIRAPPVS